MINKNHSIALFKRIDEIDSEIKNLKELIKNDSISRCEDFYNILKKKEEQFDLLFNSIPLAIFYFSENLIITKANQYFSDFLKLELYEIIGLDLKLSPDKKISRLLNQVVNNGKDVFFDGKYKLDLKDTSDTYISFFAFPLNSGSAPYSGIGIIEDLSLQKTTEKLLEDKERNYDLLFHHSPIGVLLENEKNEIIDVNEAFLNIFGANSFNIIGKPTASVFIDSQINKSIFPLQNSGQKNNFQQISFASSRGNVVKFEIQEITLPLNNKKKGTIFLVNDVSERSILEENLKKTQERYQIATDAAKVGIWDINRIQEKLFLDDTIVNILGYDRNDLNGTLDDLRNIIAPEEHKRIFEERDTYIDKDSFELNAELKVLTKNGQVKWFLNRGKLYCDSSGFVYRILGTSIDITEIKQTQIKLEEARKKAEESEKLKSSFLSNISHEIRTPLSGIMGFADLLKEDLSNEEKIEFIDIINKSALSLQYIIDGIIDLSRIESGELELKETECALQVLFRDLKSYHTTNLKLDAKDHLQLQGFVLPEKQISPIIMIDQNKLNQILNCLILNAIKFTHEGFVEVGCSLSNDNKEIVFYVKDTGIGIAPEFYDQVFIRFRQVDENHTRKYGGAGLGLALAKALIEKMDGKIWIESELNVGTTFFFTLPYRPILLKSRKSFVEEQMPDVVYDFKQKIILVIEDDDVVYSMISFVLKQHNAKVIRAVDRASASKIFLSHTTVSLILIDTMLPGVNFQEFIQEIKKLMPKTPIIIQTPNCEGFKTDTNYQYFANDFISKPINKELILAKISRFIQ